MSLVSLIGVLLPYNAALQSRKSRFKTRIKRPSVFTWTSTSMSSIFPRRFYRPEFHRKSPKRLSMHHKPCSSERIADYHVLYPGLSCYILDYHVLYPRGRSSALVYSNSATDMPCAWIPRSRLYGTLIAGTCQRNPLDGSSIGTMETALDGFTHYAYILRKLL